LRKRAFLETPGVPNVFETEPTATTSVSYATLKGREGSSEDRHMTCCLSTSTESASASMRLPLEGRKEDAGSMMDLASREPTAAAGNRGE
jgi:hypothetical protein